LVITRVRPCWWKIVSVSGAILAVLLWWLTLQPRQDRDWQPVMAEVPWAEIGEDEVTIHQVRNFEFRDPGDYTPRWETRKVRLSQITGVDVFLDQWGSEWMAHPLVSFQFADAPPVSFSIETRREKSEGFSALGGLYRMFELIYIVADERDLLQLRSKSGNSLYLYRTRLTAEQARERFLEYLRAMNALRDQPRWYNVITSNCTTSIRTQHPVTQRVPWDWRILLNGKIDELFYENGVLVSDGLSFAELKRRAFVNAAVEAAPSSPGFSRFIREGRPGFAAPKLLRP